MSAKRIDAGDGYLEKASKLIPAEAIALYVALSGMIKTSSLGWSDRAWILLAVAAFIGLMVIPLVNYRLYAIEFKRYVHHVIPVVAFALWVFNMDADALPNLTGFPSLERLVGSILLVGFTFLVPLLVAAPASLQDGQDAAPQQRVGIAEI